MFYEFINIPADISLHKWHRVREANGVYTDKLFVCFSSAIDLEGNPLYLLPKGGHVYAEMVFSPDGHM